MTRVKFSSSGQRFHVVMPCHPWMRFLFEGLRPKYHWEFNNVWFDLRSVS